MEMSINTNGMKSLSKTMKKFPGITEKALPPAINRTLTTVNTKMQKEITMKYRIKKSDLNGGSQYKSETSNNLIKIKKASNKDPSGKLTVRGSSLTLSRFLQGNKSPVSHKGKTMKQIKKLKSPKVQVKKGDSKPVKGAFVQKAKGTVGIFQRDQNGKLQMLRTLSVAQMASNKEISNTANKIAKETLEKRLEHEMKRRIEKLAGEVNGNS
jgi:hypothetical protein